MKTNPEGRARLTRRLIMDLIRIVMIESDVYHRHAVLLEHIFEPLSENQRLSLENMLKLLGRHAETMGKILEA